MIFIVIVFSIYTSCHNINDFIILDSLQFIRIVLTNKFQIYFIICPIFMFVTYLVEMQYYSSYFIYFSFESKLKVTRSLIRTVLFTSILIAVVYCMALIIFSNIFGSSLFSEISKGEKISSITFLLTICSFILALSETSLFFLALNKFFCNRIIFVISQFAFLSIGYLEYAGPLNLIKILNPISLMFEIRVMQLDYMDLIVKIIISIIAISILNRVIVRIYDIKDVEVRVIF